MECVQSSDLQSLRFEGWRCVEDQTSSSTVSLVDDLEEHELLETLLDKSKPPVPVDCEGLHYLLYTPFRYPPLLWGSRFGSVQERSIFYGALLERTCLGEAAYYQMAFWRASEARPSAQIKRFSTFSVSLKSEKGIDLCSTVFEKRRPKLTSHDNYSFSQAVGSSMRRLGVEVFLFWSARLAGQKNFGVIAPAAFLSKVPKRQRIWHASTSEERVIYWSESTREAHLFKEEAFYVDGVFPLVPG